MHHRFLLTLATLLGVWGWASVSRATPAPSEATQAIIYGTDDRVEVFEHPDPALRRIARGAIVSVMAKSVVKFEAEQVRFDAPTYAEQYGVCADERFAEQPSAGTCTGILVGPDLVLTAAHCLRQGFSEDLGCDRFAFVFGYLYGQKDRLGPVPRSDVYACARVRHHGKLGDDAAGDTEFALVELERAVDPAHAPLTIAAPPAEGDPLHVIGFPSGLPAKIDSHARTRRVATGSGLFELDSDTFSGSSGSAILNEKLELVGMLTSGSPDFEAGQGCARPRIVPADHGPWEQAIFARAAMDDFCAAAPGALNCAGAKGDADSRSHCSAGPGPETLSHHGWTAALPALWITLRFRKRRRAGPPSRR